MFRRFISLNLKSAGTSLFNVGFTGEVVAWFGVVGLFGTDCDILVEVVGSTVVTLALLVVLDLGEVDSLGKPDLFAETHTSVKLYVGLAINSEATTMQLNNCETNSKQCTKILFSSSLQYTLLLVGCFTRAPDNFELETCTHG